MKRKFIGLLCGIGLLAATGCSTIRNSQYSAPLRVKVTAELKTEVEVGEKISGTASKTHLLGLFQIAGPNEFASGVDYYYNGDRDAVLLPDGGYFDPYADVKAAAAYDAINKSGADILIAPRYKIEVTNYLIVLVTRVTVTGYKGKIKNISSK